MDIITTTIDVAGGHIKLTKIDGYVKFELVIYDDDNGFDKHGLVQLAEDIQGALKFASHSMEDE